MADWQRSQWPAQVALNSSGVDPQNAVYISPEDTLYVVAWSSVAVTLTVNVRILPPSGPINIGLMTVQVAAARSPQVFALPAGEGFVLAAVIQAFTTNNLRRGQCYVDMLFIRGSITGSGQYTQSLLAGYPTAQTPLFYPFGKVGDSFADRGNMRSIVGTTPASGAEISETVPAGAVWRLSLFSFSITTTAAAGSRNPVLVIDDGVNILATLPPNFSPPASTTWNYSYGAGLPSFDVGQPGSIEPLPVDLYLPAGFRIRTVTGTLVAGDQYTSPKYLVEEWIQS